MLTHTLPLPRAMSRDAANGQNVVVTARWALIAIGLAVTLWQPQSQDMAAIRTALAVLMGLAAVNFWLQARVLTGSEISNFTLYAASAADLLIVTAITSAYGGLEARTFVFYYPALTAFALVFSRGATVCFAMTLGAMYALACLRAEPMSAADVQVLAVRLLSLVAVAAVASAFQRVERERRAVEADVAMDSARRDQDDLFHGQIVLVTARWFLVAAAIGLTLWGETGADDLSRTVVPVLILAALNFHLHARCLVRRPISAGLTQASAVLDVLAILWMSGTWTAHGSGLANPFFVMLYPTLLAFALVFPARVTMAFATIALAGYVSTVLGHVHDANHQKVVIGRVATLAATAALGTWYFRMQRDSLAEQVARLKP